MFDGTNVNLIPEHLCPYMECLYEFAGCSFVGKTSFNTWMSLAGALRDCSESPEHALRIARYIARTPRYDGDRLLTGLPSEIEVRVLSRNIPSVERTESLPEPCEKCAPLGGIGVIVSIGGNEGIKRCDCARGKSLTAMGVRK
jgi:hypothetical protein